MIMPATVPTATASLARMPKRQRSALPVTAEAPATRLLPRHHQDRHNAPGDDTSQ